MTTFSSVGASPLPFSSWRESWRASWRELSRLSWPPLSRVPSLALAGVAGFAVLAPRAGFSAFSAVAAAAAPVAAGAAVFFANLTEATFAALGRRREQRLHSSSVSSSDRGPSESWRSSPDR